MDTVVHGDDFVAVAEDDQLDHFERFLENSNGNQASREDWARTLERWKGAQTHRQLDWRWIHLGGGPETIGKVAEHLLNLTGGKGATVPGAKDIGKG